MWECKCQQHSRWTSCGDFPRSPLVKSLKHQRTRRCMNVSANIPEHLQPLCSRARVCAGESLSLLATCRLLSARVPLLWIRSDGCSAHISTISSLICYSQCVVKKRWFPQSNFCIMCRLPCALDSPFPSHPPSSISSQESASPAESLTLWCSSVNKICGTNLDQIIHTFSSTSPVFMCENASILCFKDFVCCMRHNLQSNLVLLPPLHPILQSWQEKSHSQLTKQTTVISFLLLLLLCSFFNLSYTPALWLISYIFMLFLNKCTKV